MKKIIAIGIFIMGIVIITYPFYLNYKENKLQQDLTQLYQEKKLEVSKNESEEGEFKIDKEGVLGLVIIPSIDVSLPILYDATDENLDKGAAVVEGTSFPWEGGNTVIAAHHGRTRGRLFSRLNELEEGDEIILEFYNTQFIYNVYDMFIVEPYETDVLLDVGDKTITTLITCHWEKRLIVRGILKDVKVIELPS